MAFFKKKKPQFSMSEEDKLLDELETETKKLGKVPPMPPAPRGVAGPPAPRPPVAPPRPMPPVSPPAAPAFSEKQIAKLPLFMKVEEYDRIVQELTTLVNSLKNMEDIMAKLSDLEQEETEEAKRWKSQLERTKDQVRLLLSQLPETGKLKKTLKVKKAAKTSVKKKEVTELKKEVLQGQKVSTKKEKELEKEVGELRKNLNQLQRKKEEELVGEVNDLKEGIKGLQDEMRHMHLEFKMLNSLTQLKSSKMLKDIKGTAKPKPTPKKIVNPWEE